MADTYITRSGDQWDSIAHRELGSAEEAARLMEANRAYLAYFVFPAGITLTLPERQKRVNPSLPPWKR